ncbi:Protein of unknown function [Novosphingobium sp. CF614]|uniref:DUF3313 family protein n=1 Tax=Novosphingobium sp. CF614 TaxID=1884364 RepID=UPI0008E094D7|nr:DUF3313 family protein [Novosphingobium sp. CF614]SFG04407.1 Protein of unknown function [Novosphingobium sp. CF614]
MKFSDENPVEGGDHGDRAVLGDIGREPSARPARNGEGKWRRIAPAGRPLVLAAMALAASACQSSPAAKSGYLSSYAGLPAAERNRKSSAFHRDDKASDAIQMVFIQPVTIAPGIETELTAEEKAMVLHEVNRQICFEVSKRFLVAPEPAPGAGTIRTEIVRLQSNSRVGSVAAAAVDFVNPIPMVNFRVPASTGGLAVESEMLAPDGRQVASMLWTKNAGIVGRTKPSLSRAGDALQLAEPLGDKVAKAFATKERPKIKIGKPDPCERLGPRKNIGRTVASGVVGNVTGLYMPQVAGTSISQEKPDE